PHHHDRHSFPTRRSSDLEPRAVASGSKSRLRLAALSPDPVATARGSDTSIINATLSHGTLLTQRPIRLAQLFSVLSQQQVRINQDRKSTRLNSSHVAISY